MLSIEELTGLRKPIRFCQVDVGPGNGPDGSDEPRGIICGATNFAVGDAVVVALPGTMLPGGFQIASRETYGHISDGMICSNRELGIGQEHDGILVIASGMNRVRTGADARRSSAPTTSSSSWPSPRTAGTRCPSAAWPGSWPPPTICRSPTPGCATLPERSAGGWPVTIADPVGCGRFATVRVEGIDPTAPSPYWMRRRLTASGIRSISLAVDVTNYVMVELGQPLHAFDADKLTGSITVRRAVEGEILVTLDGVQAHPGRRRSGRRRRVRGDLDGRCDGRRVDRDLFGHQPMSSSRGPYWDPPVIMRTVRRHRLPSEAARRFERAVDPAVAAVATRARGRRCWSGTAAARWSAGPTSGATRCRRPRIDLPIDRAGAADRPAVRPGGDRPPAASRSAARSTDGFGTTLTVPPPTWRPDLTGPPIWSRRSPGWRASTRIPSVLPAAPAGTGLTAGAAPGAAGRGRPHLGRADRGALLPVPERRRSGPARPARGRRPPASGARWPTRWTPTGRR